MIFLLVLAVTALTIFLGLRVGVTSALFLFGVHITIGFAIRLAVVTYAEVPSYFYWSVLNSKFDLPIALISLQLCLGIAFTVLGYACVKKSQAASIMPILIKRITPAEKNSTVYSSIVLLLSCWAIFFIGITSIYGSPYDALSALQRRALTFGSSVTILRIFITVAFAPLLIIVAEAFRTERAHRGFKLLAATLAVSHLCGVFLTGGRGAMLTQAFVMIALIMLVISKKHLRLTIATTLAAIASAILVVIVIVGGYALRISAQKSIPLSVAMEQAIPDSMLIVSGTFPLLDMYSGAYVLARDEGLSYGENIINIGGRFIPRDIWPTKPDIVAIEIRKHVYGDRLSGAPPTVFGEFYYAFSWLGLLIGGLVLGSLIKLVDALRNYVVHFPIAAGIYFYLSFQISFGIVKSGFENSLFHVIYFALGLIAVKLISNLIRDKRGRA